MTAFGRPDNHKADLAAFQGGEAVFVWGRDTVTDHMWFLKEDAGAADRPFVKERIVCPVPGCGAKLTSAHRATKRDGLTHYSGTGSHSIESIFHSQGCALIEEWLRDRYPKSKVLREEYSNAAGERRADVMLTAATQERVAFEVQYSPLTPEAWRARHESYARQGIRDVWLFGHTGAQLKVDKDDVLKPNPAHLEVIKSGTPLLFISPIEQIIGIATGQTRLYDAETEIRSLVTVPVWDELTLKPTIEVQPLSEFKAHPDLGLVSLRLDEIRDRTAKLRAHNEAERRRRIKLVAERQREHENRVAQLSKIRSPLQASIRTKLKAPGRWSKNPVIDEIRSYLSGYRPDRIDRVDDPGATENLPVQWQCVIYFHRIAGYSATFTTALAVRTLSDCGLSTKDPHLFKRTARWLHRLEDDGFLEQVTYGARYPSWRPTFDGTWR